MVSCFVDVHMSSPSNSPSRNLRGASRITGGSIRGHAIGNVFNFADADDADTGMIVPRMGKVHLYTSTVNPVEVKPTRILKVNVSFSMGPILKSIAAKWSPVESKDHNYHCIISFVFICLPEFNPHISVFEEYEWNVKGRYNTAVEYDEDVKWIKEGNDYILPLCHVSHFMFKLIVLLIL